ncbi:unnamed protein product [Caenorhabditis brenneri]
MPSNLQKPEIDKELKIPDFCNAPVLDIYIDEEIRPFFNFQETGLTANFKSSKAAIYGGDDQEVVKELNYFREFPGSFDLFKMVTHPYSIKPIMYKSMQKQEYIYKQDMLGQLHVYTPISHLGVAANQLIRDLTGYFLRAKESRLDGLCELTPFDKVEFEMYLDQLRLDTRKLPFKVHRHKLRENTLVELFEKFKTMVPANPQDPKFLILRKMLQSFDSKKPVKKNGDLVHHILDWMSTIYAELELFVETHPETFLPRSRIANKQFPTPVRLFMDGDNKFVFMHEVLEVINEKQLDVGEFKETITKSDKLATMIFADLNKNMKEHMKLIEFVPMKIKRTEHRAVYNPSFDGKYCILTIDFFLEILFHLIAVKSIFQNMNDEIYKNLLVMFVSIRDVLELTESTPTFLSIKEVEVMMDIIKDYIDTTFGDLMKQNKKVRPVGPKGFTLKDFKSEIQYLGLNKFFKGIGEYECVVYDLIVQKKQKCYLRTCDMYEGLKIIQLWCLLDRLPHEYKWLQIQGFCHRFPLMCYGCHDSKLCKKNHLKTTIRTYR